MDKTNYAEILADKDYEPQNTTGYYSRGIRRWKNKNTGETVFILMGQGNNIKLFREIQPHELTKNAVVTANNSTWEMDDIKGEAMERKIKMSEEQAQFLLEDNAKGIADYGWGGIANVLDEVDTCDECRRAMNVLEDSETDNGSYERGDGTHICEECKEKGDYVSCEACEVYSPKEECAAVHHNPSETSYYCAECCHQFWRTKTMIELQNKDVGRDVDDLTADRKD